MEMTKKTACRRFFVIFMFDRANARHIFTDPFLVHDIIRLPSEASVDHDHVLLLRMI